VALLLVVGVGGLAVGYHASQTGETGTAGAQAPNLPAVAEKPAQPPEAKPPAGPQDEERIGTRPFGSTRWPRSTNSSGARTGNGLAAVNLRWEERVLGESTCPPPTVGS